MAVIDPRCRCIESVNLVLRRSRAVTKIKNESLPQLRNIMRAERTSSAIKIFPRAQSCDSNNLVRNLFTLERVICVSLGLCDDSRKSVDQLSVMEAMHTSKTGEVMLLSQLSFQTVLV